MAGLECGDQREARLFDDRGGAVVGQLCFCGGELDSEPLVVEDSVDPPGEVVFGAVVTQHSAVTDDELGLEFGEVGGDCPGGGVPLVAEIEAVGRLDAGKVVLVLVTQVRSAPTPERERDRLVRLRSPGQHAAAGWSLKEPGDLRWGHSCYRGGEVDEVVGGAR